MLEGYCVQPSKQEDSIIEHTNHEEKDTPMRENNPVNFQDKCLSLREPKQKFGKKIE